MPRMTRHPCARTALVGRPHVAVTANVEQEDVNLACGMSGAVAKPLSRQSCWRYVGGTACHKRLAACDGLARRGRSLGVFRDGPDGRGRSRG
jgi:hypothetical protein